MFIVSKNEKAALMSPIFQLREQSMWQTSVLANWAHSCLQEWVQAQVSSCAGLTSNLKTERFLGLLYSEPSFFQGPWGPLFSTFTFFGIVLVVVERNRLFQCEGKAVSAAPEVELSPR